VSKAAGKGSQMSLRSRVTSLARSASRCLRRAYVLPMLLNFLMSSLSFDNGWTDRSRVVALAPSMKKYYGYKFGERWSSIL